MKKVLAVFAVLLVVMALPAFAEDDDAGDLQVNTTIRVDSPIRVLNAIGNGIAIKASDPMDFSHARIIIGGVALMDKNCLSAADANREKCILTKRLGLLTLDQKVYRLRNIEVDANGLSADIYEKTGSSTVDSEANHVGSIALKRFEKPGRDVWAGDLSLNSTEYHAYFLGIPRLWKPVELAIGMGEYCRNNPTEQACKQLNLCKNNPDAEQCEDLKEKFCLKNGGDERCRELLKKACDKRIMSPFCKKITAENGVETTSINADQVSIEDKPPVTEAVERRVEIVKKVISNIRGRVGNRPGNSGMPPTPPDMEPVQDTTGGS